VKGREEIKTTIRALTLRLLLPVLLLGGCDSGPWNDPYPQRDAASNILYSSFSERPKHLDPVRSYSSNEYAFIAQIYEPPLQYHFLKRPYELVPLTLERVPEPAFFDAEGSLLPQDAEAGQVGFSEYLLRIRPGIRYQPHPAFAKDEDGRYLYHDLSPERIAAANTLADFPDSGSRELTAADYVYQIKRLAFPRLHSPITGVMAEYILGFPELARELEAADKAAREGTGLDKPYLDLRPFQLEGVQVEDRYSFRIRLQGKYPQFLYWMAMPFFAPMPWEADRFYSQPGLEKRNISLDWYPVGTGPFMLAENNPNLRMVLARNPNFHGETYPTEGEPEDADAGLLRDAGKSLPFIDRAVYSLEREDIPYWNKFLQGFYDTSGITSDSFDQAVRFNDQGEAGLTDDMRNKGIELITAVETSIFYMGFNMRDPVIGGDSEPARLLRRAISIAVDYEEYTSIFRNGRGVPAQGPIAPGIFGHREGVAGVNRYVYDLVGGKSVRKSVDEARRLLVEAGYPGGRDQASGAPLVINYEAIGAGPDVKAMQNWVRKQFAKLGIQLVVRNTDYNRFQEKMRKGTGQVFMWGWNADYPDPENFLFLLYGPNSKVEGEGENAANYRNPEFDALFERMKNMDNTPERQAIIDQMIDILRRDAPWAWGFHPKGFSLLHAWYHNVKPNLMANNTLKYKRLDPELRERNRAEWNPPVVWPVAAVLVLLVVSAVPAYVTHRRRERRVAR
jgi:oligopeptide transport system substrate-binding protein